MNIDTVERLRALYPAPKERAVRKQLSSLDQHGRRFIALSPCVVVASAGVTRAVDASPRGGAPGFVKALAERTLAVTVGEAYLHCAKAFMRSGLWNASSQVSRSLLPTLGEMISSQTGIEVPAETREEMPARYAPDL